jgi:excisionase family DNA binding protein
MSAVSEAIEWIGTPEACARLGVTLRTLYRFIDEGQLPAYKMGRVIRLQAHEVDAFIEAARIPPGTLEHLYPDPRGAQAGKGQPSAAGTGPGALKDAAADRGSGQVAGHAVGQVPEGEGPSVGGAEGR